MGGISRDASGSPRGGSDIHPIAIVRVTILTLGLASIALGVACARMNADSDNHVMGTVAWILGCLGAFLALLGAIGLYDTYLELTGGLE